MCGNLLATKVVLSENKVKIRSNAKFWDKYRFPLSVRTLTVNVLTDKMCHIKPHSIDIQVLTDYFLSENQISNADFGLKHHFKFSIIFLSLKLMSSFSAICIL